MLKLLIYISLLMLNDASKCSCLFYKIEDRSEIKNAKKEFIDSFYYDYELNREPLENEKIVLWYAKFLRSKNYHYQLLDEKYEPLLKKEIENLSCLMSKYKNIKIEIQAYHDWEISRFLKLELMGQCLYIEDKLIEEGVNKERITLKIMGNKNRVTDKDDILTKYYVHRRIEIVFN